MYKVVLGGVGFSAKIAERAYTEWANSRNSRLGDRKFRQKLRQTSAHGIVFRH